MLEGLTKFVGGSRHTRRIKGGQCNAMTVGGKRRKSKGKRSRKSKGNRSRKHGGNGLLPLNPAPITGGKKHKKRTRSRRPRRGGSPLVSLGLLGTLLAMGPKYGSKKRRSKK